MIEELDLLKAKTLVDGYRGTPPVDKSEIASVVIKVGELLRAHPEIIEIDINPLVIVDGGKSSLALDALIVVE